MATKPPSRRAVLLFLIVCGMTFAILVGVSALYSMYEAEREDRIELFQRALYGLDELTARNFRVPERAASVREDLLNSVSKMTPGHPDAAAFRALAAIVQASAALTAQSPRADLEAIEKQVAPLKLPAVNKLIRARADEMLDWLAAEKQALASAERAEAALAHKEFDAATEAYGSIPEQSCYAPRAARLRDAVVAGRSAETERLKTALAAQAVEQRAAYDRFFKNLDELIAADRLDEARAWIGKLAADAPEDVRAQLAQRDERILVEASRMAAEKAFHQGKGPSVLDALKDTTEPALLAFRAQVARVLERYHALLLAEEEGRPAEVDRLAAEVAALDPNPGTWYHDAAERVAKTDPAARASAWLERAQREVSEGHLSEARRLMEASRAVYPGAASDSAIAGLVSYVQKDFNLVSASLRRGTLTREAALARIDVLRSALLPRDKVFLMIEDYRKQLKQ